MIYFKDRPCDMIFHEEGVTLLRDLYGISEPYADILVKRYRHDSGEARPVKGDPCVYQIPRGYSGIPFSKAYFLDYFARNQPRPAAPPPPKGRRYARDEALVAEACEGIANDKWANAWQAANALAKNDTDVKRLNRKILAALK